jgi:hypothetical protein
MTNQDESEGSVEQLGILDEIDRAVARYFVSSDEQRRAMILYAAASWVADKGATVGRLMFTSADEESAKTLGMRITLALSPRAVNASGTGFDLASALAEAGNALERKIPLVVYRDEMTRKLSNSGIIGDVLREGYHCNATRGRSVSGVQETYSTYGPFIFTGLRDCVKRDVRSRCVVITTERGKPRKYYDVRDAEPKMYRYGRALGQQTRAKADQIARFRADSLDIKGLSGRRAEVWELMFAVAIKLGGPRWLRYCTEAFRALAFSEMDAPALTPGQRMLQIAAELAPGLDTYLRGFVRSPDLSNAMRAHEEYEEEDHSLNSMSRMISDEMPVNTHQRRIPGFEIPQRGYYLRDVLRAWDQVKPPEPEDGELPEEIDPFAYDEDEEVDEGPVPGYEDEQDVAGVAGVAGGLGRQPAQQQPADPRPPVRTYVQD